MGKRVRLTVRQLGYPTKNELRGLHLQYQQRQDLAPGYAGLEAMF